MHVKFELPQTPALGSASTQYWLHTFFIGPPSSRYEVVALVNTYVRLVSAAVVEYDEGSKRLREFWSTHDAINLGAMHRSVSHFESCIFNMNRATNCFRRLRAGRYDDLLAIAIKQQKTDFARDDVANRIRDIRNEVHHLEDSLLKGLVVEGQSFALKAGGPELPHPSVDLQTVKTIDRLQIGSLEVTFCDMVKWLEEMVSVIERLYAILLNASAPPSTPEAT